MSQVNETIATQAALAASHAPADIPSNTYKPNSPYKAKVLGNTLLTDPDSPNDVRHIIFDIADSDLKYLEGQSIGILPPGTDANGKPHKLRLYSIASPAVGEDGQGKTVALCVKRANTTDPETGVVYKGVCSNFLNDLKPGDTADITGPVGKSFLMPNIADANLIMIATGTGIAPFRGFLHNRYHKRTSEKGECWTFFGAQTRKDYLYKEELEGYQQHPGNHLVTAFSREEKTADGKKMYVQERLYEHRKELIALLKKPQTTLFICGLRGMEEGIHDALTRGCQELGEEWSVLYDQLKAEKRWHVEVY